ncbi:hypothetical protein EJ04DRAFT_219475 [Polyplosphaeria fusca]|uniref:Uncharacterized protein n=1 Tax=Polyplosphaeria fusca TaxID=682080 RepID=A0A9P4QZC3_9PLEO|nr:hypothetical protein EJ04DRAFT_219475 [Polyplosphaeria fusca]
MTTWATAGATTKRTGIQRYLVQGTSYVIGWDKCSGSAVARLFAGRRVRAPSRLALGQGPRRLARKPPTRPRHPDTHESPFLRPVLRTYTTPHRTRRAGKHKQ